MNNINQWKATKKGEPQKRGEPNSEISVGESKRGARNF